MPIFDNVQWPICAFEAIYNGRRRSYHLYGCSSYAHLFVWPVPANSLEIYSDDYFSGAADGYGYVDYDRDKQPMVYTFEQYLDILSRFSPEGGSLLDIGAATGFFLDLAQKRQWKTFGVEPSGFAAAIGRKKGIQIKTGLLEEGDFAEESLDVVTLWDVIEHLAEPSATIRLIHKFLKPKGVIAINTPDFGSLLARALGLKWHLIVPPEHVNLFNEKSLKVLLEHGGFEAVHVDSIGKRFTLQYVFQTLAHWSGTGIFENLASRLRSLAAGRAAVPINLYDNMLVRARKS